MTESDRSGPAERPRTLQPQQSAIRLRRPSTSGRPRRPSEPPLPPLNTDVSPQRPTPARRRAATVSAQETIGSVGGPSAGHPGSNHNQVREPSVLAPITSEAPRESQEGEESQDTGEGDEKTERRGMLSRLRWRSDTNLQTSAQAGEGTAERPEETSVDEHEYNDQIVNMLDAIDPEVTTLSSLTNVQNSLYAPPLGKWINRRPAYNLTRLRLPQGKMPSDVPEAESPEEPSPTASERAEAPSREDEKPGAPVERIPSKMEDGFFAVRPQGISFADWSDKDLDELNDHVRHMLHSRQSAMHRRLKAFGQYVRRPLGFLITLYATLITLFGLAWVLFLIGWVYVGSKQLYVIHVIDNVLVALFAIVGDGMIPWRLVDTYHMGHIARYHRLTWKLRGKMAVPRLRDKNDLPTQTVQPDDEPSRADADLEAALNSTEKEVSVLTPGQQARLEHHQQKFAKSHTFYKPHETETHYAFPLRFLITIVCLLDLHSCLQLALGLTTWLIDYRVRPAAITATILSCSICVNILAGVLIMIGDRKTRKKAVVERMFRQDLTKEAMRRVRKRQKEMRRKEEKKARKSLAADGAEGASRPSFSRFRRSTDKDGTELPRQRSFLHLRRSEDRGGTESPPRTSLSRLTRSTDKEGPESPRRTSFSRFGRLSEKASRNTSRVPSEEGKVEE